MAAAPFSATLHLLSGLGMVVLMLVALLTPHASAQYTPYTIDPLLEDYQFQRNCFVTHYPPQKPLSLQFCSKFNDLSCCVPAQDQENLEFSSSMLQDRGLSCRIRGDLRLDALAALYCINCDPNQPRYMRNMPYFPMLTTEDYLRLFPLVQYPTSRSLPLPSTCFNISGDGTLKVSLTSTVTPSTVPTCFPTRSMQVLISRDWMVDNFHIYPNIMSVFDSCLLYKSVPCLDMFGTILPNRDRFTCGKEIVNPSSFYTNDFSSTVYKYPSLCKLNNLSQAPAQAQDKACRTLYLERVLNTDAFGTPQFDENYAFRLVDNRYCSDDEVTAWQSAYNDNINGDVMLLNPHILNGPTCLLTKTQAQTLYTTYGGVGSTQYFQDELCFSSTAALRPALVLLALGVLLAMFM